MSIRVIQIVPEGNHHPKVLIVLDALRLHMTQLGTVIKVLGRGDEKRFLGGT